MYKEFVDNEAKRFLEVVGNQLDSDSVKYLQAGELAFEDANFYMKKEITGLSNLVEVIEPSNDEEVGIRNIQGSKLPSLQNLILKRVILGYATDAAITDPAKLAFSAVKPGTAVPALQNGELIIEQDDKPIFRMPVSSLLNPVAPQSLSEVGYSLENWRLIKADRAFSVKIRFANGETVDAVAKHHIEVTLVGTKTRKR